jgi:DNA repair protein RecO (recombination protein O)
MDETYRLKAVVLGREPRRENDLLVDLLTEEQGRVKLVARGAKKFRSKIAAHVEPFCLVEAMAIRGRKEDYLGSCLSAEVFGVIKGDLERLKYASEAVLLVREVIREREPAPAVFKALIEYLTYLNTQTIEPGKFQADLFVLKIMDCFGQMPDLYNCARCGAKLRLKSNNLRPNTLEIIGDECAEPDDLTISDNCIKVLRFLNRSFYQILAKKLTNRAKLAQEIGQLAAIAKNQIQ